MKVQATSGDCLNDDTVLAFVEGRLGADQLAACHRHFDECESCQWLVAEAVHAITTTHDPAVSQPLGCSLRVGALVGDRYRVERFIARGGMGEVYEAFDRALNQRIALKTVRSTISDSPKAVERLKAEVQLARRVTHPNVCRLYDLGCQRLTTKVELHFLSMEYIDGITLREKLTRDGPLGVTSAVDIARQLLCGLRAAHEAGTLHRDFKPDNVMLRALPQQPTAVVMDFGLAWALDSETPLSARSHEPLIGTLTYMAPEQVEGTPLGVGTDLYSFGIVLFEMLTGRMPFVGESPATTALKRLTERAPPPSRYNAEVPAYLDRLVLRCLEREPRRRYASALEVLAALDRDSAEPRRRRARFGPAAKAMALVGSAALVAFASTRAWSPKDTGRGPVQTLVVPARAPELRANQRDRSERARSERNSPPAPSRPPVAPSQAAESGALKSPAPPPPPPRRARRTEARVSPSAPAPQSFPATPTAQRILPTDLMLPKSFQPAPAPRERGE